MRRWMAPTVFVAAVLLGTVLDRGVLPVPRDGHVLVADLHVHPFPGDGALTVGQLRREAVRRGLDIIAVTGHNNRVALRLAALLPEPADEVIVLPGQELTTPSFHMIAAGVERLVDWRLSVEDATAAIHRQGGVAIAAHPAENSWIPRDEWSIAVLDGVEVAHLLAVFTPTGRASLDRFFALAQRVKPSVSPIGSTDFHMLAPLGRCRTYLLVESTSANGALDAIRRGRTVAEDQDGRLYGRAEDTAVVTAFLERRGPRPEPAVAEKASAVAALLALGIMAMPARRQ